MNDDDFREEGDQQDAAFEREYSFQGAKLLPFSIERQYAWDRIISKGASPLEADSLMIFLCTLSPEEIEDSRSRDGLSKFRRAMNEWSAKAGLSIHPENPVARELQSAANSMWEDIANSRFTIKDTGGSSGNE